jgi:hypothetical protein
VKATADKDAGKMSIHSRRFALILTLTIMSSVNARAALPSVSAVLSDSQPAVGQMVQLEIKVNGANSANVPETISVDGLEIHQTGTSRQFEMRNFDVTSSVTYSYTVQSQKAGTFKIPPQTVRVGSNLLRTPELVLNVAQGSGTGPGSARTSPQGNQSQIASKIGFAELVVAKEDAYVGEMVPVVIRLGFDSRAHGRLQDVPEFNAQGFTTQKWQEPHESLETIGGRTYQVLTFKTAIAAARPGKLEIGPVTTRAMVILPRRPSAPPRNRPRSPFDLFNLDDPFSDPLFSDPFGMVGERTELALRSETATLNVKALPPNAPPNFSGAVGNFTMSADAKPQTVQIGDPITLTATISGRGNFDRMNGPALEDERGWHKYPPSSRFKQDDDIGISGEKTFEMVLAPNERKSAVPPLVFAYFDPAKGNYVTLRSDPIPVAVEGGTAPPAGAVAIPSTRTTAATSSATVANTPSPTAKPADILYQLTDLGSIRSFTPIYLRPAFWIAQLGPLLVLFGFAGWQIHRAKIGDRNRQRIAARRHEIANLLRELRRGDVSPQVYFSQAARVVFLKTALAKNINPNAVDSETVAQAFDLSDTGRAQLRELFERSDELTYSGTGNGAETISGEERERVLTFLETLHA